MEEKAAKPKIVTEINAEKTGALLVAEDSPLARELREVLISKGIAVNQTSGFNYIFQIGNLQRLEFFLAKAKSAQAKFFLILDQERPGASQKAEDRFFEFVKKHKVNARVIKLSGFAGQEIEAVKKILKLALSQTPEKTITLAGPGIFWRESKKQPKGNPKKGLLFWPALTVLTVFLLTLPITFILANIFLGTLALKNAKAAVFSSQFEKGRNQALAAQEHFRVAKNGFTLASPLFKVLNKEEKAREITNWLEIGEGLGRTAKHLVEIGWQGQKLALLILGQEEGRTEELVASLTADVGLAEEELALLVAKAQTKPLLFGESLEQIREPRKNLLKIKSLLQAAPWLLGRDQKRTYLVLLQNNFELRPGGGFIGAIGLLTLDNGKLDLKLEDVYTADGQLRGHVEPPKPIRQYLNQIHWYLRDSNWDPDFTVNAQKAAWFYEKEMGIKVDGVVALDLALAQKTLALTGPIDLPDYQEKITADNLFLKTQIYTQERFFPGSTQKRDFLSSLATAVFRKLSAESKFSWLKLAKAVSEAAQEKHLFVYFTNEMAQKIVSNQGWGGEIGNEKCKTKNEKLTGENCLSDYLMVIEANLGVNKVNYFLKREIQKEANLVADSLTSKVTITYENTSPANVSFGGNYKNYLRILTPPYFSLEKVSLDGQEASPDKVDQENLAGKISTGFLVEVAPGTKKKVEVFYKMPVDPSWDEFTYRLLVQKQAGTDKDPLIIESNFGLSYKGDLAVDRLFQVRVKKGRPL